MSRAPMNEQRLTSLARRLPLELAPAADLWPPIAARIAADVDGIDGHAARLPAEIEPPADLWPGIAARLDEPHAPRATRVPLTAAASFGIATVATLAALFTLPFGDGPSAPSPPLSVPTLVASIGDAAGLSIAGSNRALRGTSATIAEALAGVRRERLELEHALENDADNRDLHALWSHAYRTELALAGEVSRTAERYEWSPEI